MLRRLRVRGWPHCSGKGLKSTAFLILPLRRVIELDRIVATFGSLSAASNRLDPVGLDETVKAEIDWVTTARAGIEQAIGSATVFITGGLALARIDNSVTDIDFGPNRPTQVDPDDSFSADATEIGWVLGVGVEAPLAADWRLRLEGSYLDFGRSTPLRESFRRWSLRAGDASKTVSLQR